VPEAFLARELEICYAPGGVRDELRGRGCGRCRTGPAALFEGMLPPGEAAAVEAAKNAIPGIAIAAARAVAGEKGIALRRFDGKIQEAGRHRAPTSRLGVPGRKGRGVEVHR